MFIIYGWKRYAQVLAVLTLVCQHCSAPAEHVLRRLTTKVTLFFIPLFPISRRHTLICTACRGENKVSREQADQLAASAQPYAGPPAPPHEPAYGQRYQAGPPPMQQPGPYGNQPPYGYQPGQPPMGQQQYPGPTPPPGYPQQPYPGR